MRRITRSWLLAGLLAACASKTDGLGVSRGSGDAGSSRDAADEQFPIEGRRVSVTMYGFWGIPDTDAGFGRPEPLSGVEVCQVGVRPRGAPTEPLRASDRRCAPPSKTGEKIVLEGVPADAEVAIEAALPGYRPTLYAATTSLWAFDSTSTNSDAYQMQLRPTGALARAIAGADPELGSVTVVTVLCSPQQNGTVSCVFVEGATLSLDAPGASPPRYARGGVVAEGRTSTIGGIFAPPTPDISEYGTTEFVDLPPGEFTLRIEHPLLKCGAWSPPLYGHAGARPSEVRVPVMPGHTTLVASMCACKDVDATSCESDASARPEAGSP